MFDDVAFTFKSIAMSKGRDEILSKHWTKPDKTKNESKETGSDSFQEGRNIGHKKAEEELKKAQTSVSKKRKL